MKNIKIYMMLLLFASITISACKKEKSAELTSNLEETVLDRKGWTVTASSQEGTNLAAAVLDGYTNTFWSSNATATFPHWLLIDMKSQTVITKIGLTTKQGDPKGFTKFRLEGSNDGTNFTSFGEFTFVPATFTEQSFTLSPARNVRYIRLTALDKAATQTGTVTFLSEFTVTGLQERKPLTDVALGKTGWTATASSEVNFPGEETNLAAHVVDVISAKSPTAETVPSFWQADYDVLHPYPHWIIVDMKKASLLSYVGLNAHTDAKQGFTKFSISGSTDGTTFTQLGDDRNFNPTTTNEQKFAVSPAAPIRYVKITLLEGSAYPCLANFEAYVKL
ncbi:discoidin domain-containing protein [Pedobacter punctiformis]|uniref:Discoidin domain-containing protein n=1 Tax=Pedobacter punctiformis TaxID=3004097 RepID=A0ABT4L3T9_9SPHI|nr:discoidin domain-containing protein [Pedobacter sp. HCMS5-2]MCZ4242592.1 discoidin domain-containing protein [Pedobacter sp. HCMS5-2]